MDMVTLLCYGFLALICLGVLLAASCAFVFSSMFSEREEAAARLATQACNDHRNVDPGKDGQMKAA